MNNNDNNIDNIVKKKNNKVKNINVFNKNNIDDKNVITNNTKINNIRMIIKKSIIIIIMNLVFSFLLYTFSLPRSIFVYTPDKGTNRDKYFNQINYEDKKCRLWREMNTFPSISSLIGCAFSIFRLKTYEPTPSEVDIKRLVPRRHKKY